MAEQQAPKLIITIAPGRDGTHTLLVSLRQADGTQAPPQVVSIDDRSGRLGAFVAAMEAIAGQQADRA